VPSWDGRLQRSPHNEALTLPRVQAEGEVENGRRMGGVKERPGAKLGIMPLT